MNASIATLVPEYTNGTITVTGNAWNGSTSILQYPIGGNQWVQPATKHETAMEWLERRVREMRIKL